MPTPLSFANGLALYSGDNDTILERKVWQMIANFLGNGSATSPSTVPGGGISGAAHLATGQLTAGAVALLAGVRPTRRSICITNTDGTNGIYYGNSGVTTGNGAFIDKGLSQVIDTTAAIYVVAAAGAPVVTFTETYD